MELTDTVIEQYRLFRKECNKHISSELRTGQYEHLRGRNTKGSKKVGISKYKARVNILGRMPQTRKTFQRNLQVGSLETVVVVQASLKDDKDYRQGFDIDKEKKAVRFILGENLSFYNVVPHSIGKQLNENYGLLVHYLSGGEYYLFVRDSLSIVNTAMDKLKSNFTLENYL